MTPPQGNTAMKCWKAMRHQIFVVLALFVVIMRFRSEQSMITDVRSSIMKEPTLESLLPRRTETDLPRIVPLDLPKDTNRAKCGEVLTELQDNSEVVANLIDLIKNNAARTVRHSIRSNIMGHSKGMVQDLLLKQSCLYNSLDTWNQLTADLGISRWVTHGGSSIGAKCYGGLNPWDDDIDITVLDCQALDELWKNGERNITSRYPTLDERSHSMRNGAAIWDARLIATADGDMILTRGEICCNWYKLMSVTEAFMWKPGNDFVGIDIECMDRKLSGREKSTQMQSGWTKYLKGTDELYTVAYGPTTIQIMDPEIMNRYIEIRYGKLSPCQFPFTNGVEIEKIPPVISSHDKEMTSALTQIFQEDQDQAQMNFALKNWYVPRNKREEWLGKKGNKKQLEYTEQLPNFDKIEIDNTISSGCKWGATATMKVIGWNAERGTHWDEFYNMIQEMEELKAPLVILLNEMDIGMARSGNVHTARRLALQLGMNYAYGVEFLELTRGTREEQEKTEGSRDALSLHGNAILSKCILGDSLILRDPLPHTYFSDKAERGINADGYEVRLGGRMGLFARIFEKPSPIIPRTHNVTNGSLYIPEKLPPHFVVGNVHKLKETKETRAKLWSFYGFGAPTANSTSIYDGKGIDLASSQHGVIIQGDFGPQLCSLGGLEKMNNYKVHKTFRSTCLPNGKSKIGPLSGDFFCTNMIAVRGVKVTPPCNWSNNTNPLTLADHAIVSIEVKSNKTKK